MDLRKIMPFLVLIIFVPLSFTHSKMIVPTKTEIITKTIVKKPSVVIDTLYNSAIEHLQITESYRGSIYIDNDGSETIGYGHHLLKGEKFTKISKKQARKLLEKDFNKRIKWVKKRHNLTGAKAYAIALFVYNCGEGTYAKSTLRKRVDAKKSINTIIIKYCKYKYNGSYHTSRGLLKRRLFELKMYNI